MAGLGRSGFEFCVFFWLFWVLSVAVALGWSDAILLSWLFIILLSQISNVVGSGSWTRACETTTLRFTICTHYQSRPPWAKQGVSFDRNSSNSRLPAPIYRDSFRQPYTPIHTSA